MLKIRIIPCLDVKDGRIVKGINFLNLVDAGDPVEQAKIYDLQGADELCFLDIGASIEKRGTIIDIVKKTASECFMPLTVGGGVRSYKDVRELLLAGADKVSINTQAIKNPKIIYDSAKRFGNQCVVVAIDAKRNNSMPSGFEVFIYGGKERTNIDVLEWAKKAEDLGAGEILLTSMDNDGTKKGYNLELTKIVSNSINLPLIASGGVGTPKHFVEGASLGGASGLLAASIFHYGESSIREVKKTLIDSNIPTRL